MANFHSNMLAIVADEENMMRVMLLFWENYESAAEESDFHSLFPERPTLTNLWQALRMQLDQWYEYAFRKDYLGSEGNRIVSEATTESGVKMGISVVPYGRPYSDTAVVNLVASGQYYVFLMKYSTAWISNFDHDVYDFMKRLPQGRYGIAYLDADEGDWYENISAQQYLWLGQGEAEREDAFGIDAKELKARFDALVASGMDELDLADRALAEDMKLWMEDPDFDDYRDEPRDELDETLASLDWGDADHVTMSKAWSGILRELDEFPFETGVSGTAYLRREANIETLLVGDELVLRSDWRSPYFFPVGIEAFTIDGASIGNLATHGVYGCDFLSDSRRTALALVLPHIRAVVQEVEPLFLRRGNAKYSHIRIRLDLCVVDWDELKEEIEALLVQSPEERTRKSWIKGRSMGDAENLAR